MLDEKTSLAASGILQTNRLVSLDVFRGMVIAGMILVTDPGTYSYVYSPLRHAEWMGATATDMIFPAFLFMAGLSICFSFASQIKRGASHTMLVQRLLRRSLLLFILGLVLNGFPDYHLGTLRIPGILQRIAICYLCSGALSLIATSPGEQVEEARISKRVLLMAGVAFGLLALYWALLKLVPVPGIGAGHLDTFGSLPAYIDRRIFGINHLWIWGLTPGKGVDYDPEGLLSTLPAMFSTLAGIVAGEWMRSGRAAGTKGAGPCCGWMRPRDLRIALEPTSAFEQAHLEQYLCSSEHWGKRGGIRCALRGCRSGWLPPRAPTGENPGHECHPRFYVVNHHHELVRPHPPSGVNHARVALPEPFRELAISLSFVAGLCNRDCFS
jgi:hypothetical protein